MTIPTSPAGMSRTMTLLFALAGASAVGNLYWAQPLLTRIAEDLGVSASSSGVLVTVTQLGYALGVLLLVPLGDAFNRRRFIPMVMGLSVLSLLFCSLAPGYGALLGGLAVLGVTTISGQLLVPLAGDLASTHQRGTVIGTIASSMLIGIMLSRFISGVIADAFGWRAVYVTASVINIIFVLILARVLPGDVRRQRIPYGKLLGSIVGTVANSRPAKVTLLIGASLFVVFMMFWSGMTFLLSAQPFSYTPAQIGLVNLFGLIGAFAAQRTGLLHDRGWSTWGTGAALLLVLISVGILAVSSISIVLITVSIILFNLASQVVNILNQTRLLSIRPELRSRMNTAFVFCNFIAGAVGSALAGICWEKGGWPLLITAQIIFTLAALIIWASQRKVLFKAETTALKE
jgi:Arabinose efflux permease